MSVTTILAVYPNKMVKRKDKLHNGWGSAPHVWFAIWDYAQKNGIIKTDGEFDYFFGSNHSNDLWKLWDDERMPLNYRVMLLITYDKIYVKKENYERFTQDIEKFFNDFPIDEDRVNHWPRIIEELRTAKYPAMGFWWTNVGENPMDTYGKKRDWSEYTELYEGVV